ncbi:hypothetical protein C900_02421 [Fulvivirga imtechensis AK7]|uniref:Aminoglycoside phosphotransferase domain-containing protein n=1 Tax=Fulvivirga imtechensis AK7 TaxID=1237149 RepID=L8JTP4_9BACT|nr:hypothetical protein [Fulvivirga imtechensis]ELR71613.1 hypothetical protein C900_02421 [Fulvivirga imtechensis AK7]
MSKIKTLSETTYSLDAKVNFLRRRETYPGTSAVEAIETHMSWVFLTDGYVYKLKKPVRYDFLDFRKLESRYRYCMEEASINQPLAGDTYLGVIPLRVYRGALQLDGEGEAVDWLVKMKRLPEEYMLDVVIKEGTSDRESVLRAARKLVDFYHTSNSFTFTPSDFRQRLIKRIELNSEELLQKKFALERSQVLSITTDLIHFIMHRSDLFDQRIAEERIIECHGDLRPEHICLAPQPVIIDRVEFDWSLRIMDVAEELSFLMLECELLGEPSVGRLFLNTYEWKSEDKVPEELITFYKAKRAFLRAWLAIHHLLEKKYKKEEPKWRNICETYLQMAVDCCRKLVNR